MEASHGLCKRQMKGGWTPSRCGVTEGSYIRLPWIERKTNDWVLDKIGNRLMLREMVQRRKLRFFGHVIRRKGLERTIITGKVNGKRKRGRPPTSWLKDIKSSTGMKLQYAVRAAEDRERWRRIVKTTASHNATSDWREREIYQS